MKEWRPQLRPLDRPHPMMELGKRPTLWTPSSNTTPMPMYTCASMWQWNSHTPGLSATNLTAVHPMGCSATVFFITGSLRLNRVLPLRGSNRPSSYPSTHPKVVPVEVPRVRLAPVVERHHVLQHHVHHRPQRQPVRCARHRPSRRHR